MNIDINNLTSVGMVSDQPAYMLPPEAWSLALNMRAKDGGMERMGGWAQTFGAPMVVPHFVMHLSTPAQPLWMYASLEKASCWNGITHSDITRVSGDYNAGASENWNRTILGGIPIINNGVDLPQMWVPAIPGGDLSVAPLQDLENWPSGKRARVMRAFGPYLVAASITEGGVPNPHRVLWSHPADPGGVPISWDITDPSKDCGQVDLPDVQSGVIVDMLPLQGLMYIYKEGSIWAMRPIGGRNIFSFVTLFETTGCLAPRCVAITGDGTRHAFASQDDIVWHDGQRVRSMLDKRMRRRVFNEIDPANFRTSFMFCNPEFNEMWFCYPSQGSLQPDTAVVWNYSEKEIGVPTRVEGITFRGVELGEVEESDPETWASAVGVWDDDFVPWNLVSRHKLVAASPDNNKLYMLDQGTTRDGVAFLGTLAREGLALLGRDRTGSPIVDFEAMKMVRALWPKIRGGPVEVRVGSQMLVDGPITWNPVTVFDPTQSGPQGVRTGFVPLSGRALAVQFEGANAWRIDGYKYDVVKLGTF